MKLQVTKKDGMCDIAAVQNTMKFWLQTAANGEYTITMQRNVKHRTDAQNRLMWKWFEIIARGWSDAVGYTITAQEAHDAYCTLFIGKATPHGKVAGNTSKLTTAEMTSFLERVRIDAAVEYGIRLPTLNDLLENLYQM